MVGKGKKSWVDGRRQQRITRWKAPAAECQAEEVPGEEEARGQGVARPAGRCACPPV